MIAMSAPNDLILKAKLDEAIEILSGIQQTMGMTTEQIKEEWDKEYPKVKKLAKDIYDALVVSKDMFNPKSDPLEGYLYREINTGYHKRYILKKKE